jgi:hypothetical protein
MEVTPEPGWDLPLKVPGYTLFSKRCGRLNYAPLSIGIAR